MAAAFAGIFVSALAAGLTATAASAKSPETAAVAAIIAPTPGAKLCFRRVYDAAHLRGHPHQKVREMTLLLRVVGYDAHGNNLREKPDHIAFNFALAVRRRGDRKLMTTAGDCSGGERAMCAVDCDGGAAFIEKPASGDGLVLKLEGEGIAFGNDCDTTRGVFLPPGEDDKAFLLDGGAARNLPSVGKRRLWRLKMTDGLARPMTREIRALRRDVTARWRRRHPQRKLQQKQKQKQKQKQGKKRMPQLVKVEIPQEAFIAALKMDS